MGIRWESNGNVVLPDLAEAGGLILVDQSVSVFVAFGVLDAEEAEDLGDRGVVNSGKGHLSSISLVEVLLEGVSGGLVGETGEEGQTILTLTYRSFLMPS